MLYMTISNTEPTRDASTLAVVELTEEATLECRWGNRIVTAERTRYTPEAWYRAFTYGEERDVKDGAAGVTACKEHKIKKKRNGKDIEVPAPLDPDDEAEKHALRILAGYYSGDIVEKKALGDAVREYRKAIYDHLKKNKLTEQKIGKLGNTRESVTAKALEHGVAQERLDAQWAAAEAIEAAMKAARAVKLSVDIATDDADDSDDDE